MKKTGMKRFLISLLTITVISLLTVGGFLLHASADVAHEHDGVTFEAWTSTNSLPTSGNYCLVSDVTVSSTTTITGTLNLCLCGHGIRMSGTSRIFYVSGGAFGLYDCDTTTTHKYNISAPAQGAGLATVNDALTENYETFTGGYVTGANTSQWGAAVCIENGGLFTLNGGTIIGNTMSGSMGGGGVALKGYSGDRFVMNGGAVIGNTITNGWGGGIYIHEGASFTMNGGVIKENYASKSGNGCGGGISIEGGSSSFILTGGQIVDNVAQNHGGNVNLAAATTKISGSVIITGGKLTSGKGDNVYVNGTRVLNIDGALGSDASIGVTRATGAFTSGWNTAMGNADPSKYFTSDNANYGVLLKDGEAEIGNVAASVTVGGGDPEYFGSFDAAVSAWKNGGTLKLLKDASCSNVIEIRPGKGFTANDYVLDLNGNTLNLNSIQVGKDNSPNIKRTGPKLTVEDSKTGGTINISGCNMIDYGGLMVLRGGTITGGNGTWGACFLLHIYGSLDMYDGVTLTGNASNSYAGGVFVGSDSEFNMYGGKICQNSAANYGGGVVTSDNNGAIFNMYGGEISGNNAKYGNGVAILTGEFNVKSDSAIIKDGVYLANGRKINIESELSSTPISVTLESAIGVFTSGWNTYMGNADPANYFVSENSNYVAFLKDGEAQIGDMPHEHDGLSFTKWTSTNSLPTTAGNYYLTGDVTISSTWNVPSGTTNLCLNGHGIIMTGNGSVVSVGSGATLNLYDCGDTVHKYTVDENHLATVNDALNGVNGVDYFTFTGGYITGGKMTAKNSAGGGVKVASGAYFTMNGGTIIGNSADMGGGVYCSNNFVMNGGTIRNNIAPAISGSGQRNGGGVYINTGSSFTMNGGTITENWCANAGSGILLQTGAISFTMNGGAVVNNYKRGIGNNMKQKPVQLGSAAVVEGNVDANGNPCDIWLIQSGNKVQLLGERTNTTPIAVLMASPGVFTSGWSTYMTDGEGKVADPADYFVSNNSDYGVVLKDGEAAIVVKPHEHNDITYTKWTSTNSLPTTAGNYYLASDVTISSTWEAPNGVNLCLCGHGIKKTGTGSVIKVGEGRTLKIYDCDTTTEHRYSIVSPATNGAGVATVNDALTSGYQTFKGGYITGGYLTGGYQYGAGINLEGNGATLYMYGGTIIGNRLTAGSTGGGGVCVQDWDKSGGFYMYGGSIIGNTSNYGGGVYVRSGKMELIDGNISKNVANGNIGGGVLVFGGNSTLVVKGGSISDNKAVHGGAVEASGDGTVTISGGSFTNNIATGKGGALTNQRTDGNTSPASFNISGAPVFSGNTANGQASEVYLCNTAVLNLTAELTNTTKIGITKASTTGAITSGWSTYMTDGEGKVADPADYFVSNNSDYVIKLDTSGEAKIAPPHTHEWSYEAVGNVITATCTGTGTCDLTAQTITISATGKVYDGTAVTATVTKSTDWSTNIGLSEPSEITYSGNTDAGTYTASVTVGTATAEIEFVIEPLTMTVTSSGYTGDYDGQSHGITVTVTVPTDATVKYGTVDGTYDLDENPTYTNAGTYTVYYQVTRKNYATVTGSETVQINKINATVTIVGNNSTVDYDATEHTVTDYVATADTALYDVTKDFDFSGNTTLQRTNAGTTEMGLTAEQFANNNANFDIVTFLVTDGYITVNKINVTVTVEGNTDLVYYNGEPQTVSGYTLAVDNELYDVYTDIEFVGNDTVVRNNVGLVYMGLTPDDFVNLNENFNVTTLIVYDGYIMVDPIDAVITFAPESNEPVYNGKNQELVSAGIADGGTFLYAIGADAQNVPSNNAFDSAIPCAAVSGVYYVWYKVEGDDNHNDIDPECVVVEFLEEGDLALKGILYQNDGVTPIANATVKLMQGSETVETVTTGANGKYQFKVLFGVYNVVAEYEGVIKTMLVEFFEDSLIDIVMPYGNTVSRLDINSDDELKIAVGGLDEEAYYIRTSENIPENNSVSVVMTVEAKTDNTATNAGAIIEVINGKSFEFFDITIEKTVNSVTTVIDETATVLEIAVAYPKTDRHDIVVYSYHGSSVQTFTESDTKAAGTFRIDKENGIVYIYSNRFSTYAIGYTPYYRVDASLSFGSYNGTVTATLQSADAVFTLENVGLGNIVFEDVPKGEYTLTITWEDGVFSTLSMPLTVGGTSDGETATGDDFAALPEKDDKTVDLRNDTSVSYNGAAIVTEGYEVDKTFLGATTVALVNETVKQKEVTVVPRKRDVFQI